MQLVKEDWAAVGLNLTSTPSTRRYGQRLNTCQSMMRTRRRTPGLFIAQSHWTLDGERRYSPAATRTACTISPAAQVSGAGALSSSGCSWVYTDAITIVDEEGAATASGWLPIHIDEAPSSSARWATRRSVVVKRRCATFAGVGGPVGSACSGSGTADPERQFKTDV